MCGIIGTICKTAYGFDREDLSWFQQALIVDSLRGLDSTGLFMVNNDQEVSWAKVASHPLRLLQQKKTETIFNDAVYKGRALVGHNRKATVGNITNENAHPFIEKNIILVHNGAVHNSTELAKEAGVEVEVDSHVIAHLLSTEKDVPAALAKLRGAFAIVWYNQTDHTLNMVRNDDRPLAFSESDRAVFFASEPDMLDWTLSRRIQPSRFKPAQLLAANKVVTFDLETVKASEQPASFKEFHHQSPTPGPTTNHGAGAGHSRSRVVPPSNSPVTVEVPKEGEIVAFVVKGLDKQTRQDTGEVKYLCSGVSTKGAVYRGFLDPADCMDRLDAFKPGTYVTGKVRHLVYRNGVLAATWVESIRSNMRTQPKEPETETAMIRTFNNMRLTHKEWEHLCDNSECSVCNGPLLFAWPKYTSVNTNGSVKEKIVCPECMAARFRLWSEKEQGWVLKNAGINPLDYYTEKRAIAGPSTLQ